MLSFGPLMAFLYVVAVGAGLLVVAVLAIALWVAVNIVSEAASRKAGR